MTGQTKVSFKIIGKKKAHWEFLSHSVVGSSLTLKDLITQIVEQQVDLYNQDTAVPNIAALLTKQDIQDFSESGKILIEKKERQPVKVAEACDTALAAFKDSLYKVFVDDKEVTNLNEQLTLTQQSSVLFLKLTMLTGGYLW